MNLKSKLISVLALIGVISCSRVYATEITSVFSGERISRKSIQEIALTSELNTNKILGITKTRENGNWYGWNKNTVGDEKIVWKIGEYISESQETADYSNLYYCLNAERGFGLTNGEMANGSTDDYLNSYDMKNSTNKSNIGNLAGGNLGTNYDKILWILENSYVPGQSTIKDKENLLKKAASYRDITRNFSEYLSNTLIDNDSKIDLTEEQIEVVQQLAIWHFTNEYNITSKILYKNGNEIDEQGGNYDVGNLGVYFVNEGEIIAWKMEALYNYFIEAAPSSFSTQVPSLSLSNTNATIVESGENYLVGPFSLVATNKELIKNITANVNVDYTLLNSSKESVANNDFSKVVGNEFYLKIEKSKITNKADIQIELTGLYNEKELTLLTNANDPTNTQPVVLLGNKEKSISTTIDISIELVNILVEKIWEDANNVDGVRPGSVKVQLYKDGLEYGNFIKLDKSNNWKYAWEKLLDGKYTVKELNNSNTPIEDGKNYNADYTVSYKKEDNKIIVTNKHIPEITQKTVTKIWEDGNNADGIRPEEITVELYKINNGQEETIETKKLNNSNNWTYTWNQLPKKADGKNIVYGIKEITSIDGYETKYSAEDYSNVDLITITNTHISKDLAIQIQKVDEQGTIITSSEAEFEIKGAQDLTSKTNKGILDLNAQKLVGLEFSFDYTIKELIAPSGYNGLSEEISVKISGTTKEKRE